MPLKRIALKLARKLGCLGPLEPEGTEPIPIQHMPEHGEEQEPEPGRPYQDYVESEARAYWQEITQAGGLSKPTLSELIIDTMPLKLDSIYRTYEELRYAMAETSAMQPWPQFNATQDGEPEQPYRAFVESEARKYWQEIGSVHNLAKPDRENIRAAAMPILCQALRNSYGHKRHQAVAGMVQHAMEKGWIRRPAMSEAYESPSCIEALIQLADDANWLAREIPFPDHPPPHHPPIYYTIGSRQGRPVPVPREDAVIRGDYLYKRDGSRLTEERCIHPVPILPDSSLKNSWITALYPLFPSQLNSIDRNTLDNIRPVYYGLTFERARKPLNRRGVCIWFDWKEEAGDETVYFSGNLRNIPFMSILHFSPNPWDMIPGQPLS